jgi:hypothetical protein
MQITDKLDYQNRLNKAVGLSENKKKGSIIYFDDNKIKRWYVIEESANKDILAFAKTAEELSTKLNSIEVTNMEDFNKILKYNSVKKIQESSTADRLFYTDTICGVKNNKLRGILTENQQLPPSEQTYDQIMAELDAYPGQPEPYPTQGASSSPEPTQTSAVMQGSPAGQITGALGNEMDFVLSDIFDEVLSKIKELRAGCQDQNKANLYHHTYENMFETRKKWIESIKKRLEETSLGANKNQQPQNQPQNQQQGI